MQVTILSEQEFDIPQPDGTVHHMVVVTYRANNLPPRMVFIDKPQLNDATRKRMIAADLAAATPVPMRILEIP